MIRKINFYILLILVSCNWMMGQAPDLNLNAGLLTERQEDAINTSLFSAINGAVIGTNLVNYNKPTNKSNLTFALLPGLVQTTYGLLDNYSGPNRIINMAVGLSSIATTVARLVKKQPTDSKVTFNLYAPGREGLGITARINI